MGTDGTGAHLLENVLEHVEPPVFAIEELVNVKFQGVHLSGRYELKSSREEPVFILYSGH